MKSLKIRLKLDKHQQLILNTLSNEHRLLYNHLLNYTKENGTDFKDLNETYKNYRNNNKLTINSKSAQNTCRTFIDNIKSYYSLRKRDKTAKFPYKFKSWKYFTSFWLDWNNGFGGFKIKDNVISVSLNSCKNKLNINIPDNLLQNFGINEDTIKVIVFKQNLKGDYYINIVYSEKSSNTKSNIDNYLSIDLGMSNIATCYSNVIDPFAIQNNKFDKLERTENILQSIRDKKKKNSKQYKKIQRKFNQNQTKRTNKLKDYQHKLSKKIIEICKDNNIGTLIVGDIQTKKVIRKENMTLKSTSKNFGLSRFKTFLEYKAKNENMIFIKVNEAYTSQINSLTGMRSFKEIKLSQRLVKLNEDIEIDRDLNSAINIAKRTKGECYPQFETINNRFHKMYMNQFSKLICI